MKTFYDSGKTEKSSNSNVKLKVSIDYISSEACKAVYSKQGKQIIESQICAGGAKGKKIHLNKNSINS